MSDMLTIANKALRKIGMNDIQMLTQKGPAADKCNSAIRDVLKEVLRAHPWSDFTEWVTLNELAKKPPFGYGYAYQFPKDTVRVIDVREIPDLDAPTIDFEMKMNKVVFTDASKCYARYVAYSEDLTMVAPDFIDAVACKLAVEIAPGLSKQKMLKDLKQEYIWALDVARLSNDASNRERTQDEEQITTFLTCRN